MLHLGDITKIDGAKAPAVEVVIGGSPCQDLSVAGKRAGLAGERSGLFMEQIRIIKEMRRESERSGATVIIPRYMVWENVPGAFSSNGGEDFRAVLEETARVADASASIPRPTENWTNAGAVMGNGWSIAWRVLDAQFWGVPQRRRRIALVADFGGFTAPEILFERNGLSRSAPPSGTPWKDFAASIAKCFGEDNQAKGTGKLYAYDRRQGVAPEVSIAPTVCAKYGTGGDNIPIVLNDNNAYAINSIYDARGNGDGNIAPTLIGDHENRVTDYTALCVRERCGCAGGGKGLLVQEEKSGTLATNNDQFISAIALDRAAFNQGINARYDMGISEDGINSMLTARGESAVCDAFKYKQGAKAHTIAYQEEQRPCLSSEQHDISVVTIAEVRRLTPLECERLQGYPDGWTDIGKYKDTKGKERAAADTARYKALGNSIALPPWAWILERLSFYCEAHTMASLFDGIGGFPLIWETLNGEGTCLWASEIEDFAIAVTKRRFNGGCHAEA